MNLPFGFSITPFADSDIPNDAFLVDEVESWPITVPIIIPGREVVIDRNREPDLMFLQVASDILYVALVGKLR